MLTRSCCKPCCTAASLQALCTSSSSLLLPPNMYTCLPIQACVYPLIVAGKENLLKHNVHTAIPYLSEICTLVVLVCLYPVHNIFCQSSQAIISLSVQMLSFININVFSSLLVCVYFTFAVAWIFVNYESSNFLENTLGLEVVVWKCLGHGLQHFKSSSTFCVFDSVGAWYWNA